MTFEEFLIKKKINPDQLKKADQDFFNELKSHFNEMGEKSFDHSKKFWFNKLRRAHPLPEEVKIPVTEVLEAKPTFKARFNANINTKEQVKNNQVEETEKTESGVAVSPESAKTTYKPRFKAAAKTADKLESKEEQIEPQKEIVEPKPAYRPRFKAGVVKKDEE